MGDGHSNATVLRSASNLPGITEVITSRVHRGTDEQTFDTNLQQLSQHETIERIALRHCGLEVIPASLAGMPRLRSLNMEISELADVSGLAALQALESINLSARENSQRHTFTLLPDEIVNFPALRSLMLRYCKLTRLPVDFERLGPQLQVLDLSGKTMRSGEARL